MKRNVIEDISNRLGALIRAHAVEKGELLNDALWFWRRHRWYRRNADLGGRRDGKLCFYEV
jgi:hypothetical protein